jgi:hypothetical protein
MPEPAAELTLYCYTPAKDRSEVANGIVRECGFRSSVVDGSVMEMDDYTLYQYEPFEDREANVELLDKCLQSLREEFPEMEVWLRSKTNKDYGNPVSEDHLLYIAPNRETVE